MRQVPDKIQGLRRQYQQVAVQPVADGFAIMIDGRALLTPAGQPLHVVSHSLAQEVAAEWAAQDKMIDPASMPMNQLVITALDRVAPQRTQVIDGLLAYLTTELICHYGSDEKLVAQQRQCWQKLHGWLAETFNVVLPVTFGITPIRGAMPVDVLKKYLENLDDYHLCAVQQAVAVTSSLVIGMALCAGVVDASVAVAAAEAEADFQAMQWGVDAVYTARRTALVDELAAVVRFLGLV